MTDENSRAADPLTAAVSMLQVASNRDDSGSVPFFVSDRIAPRRRRSSDIGRLLFATLAFALFGWAAANESDFDLRVLEALQDLPGVGSITRMVSVTQLPVSLRWSIAVISVAVAGIGRGLVRDLILALFLATLLGSIGSRLDDW